jgi:tRNA nucleotidyltransferase (CCA-adding enzyme)
MTEKKDRDRVMAEITLSHVLRLATEQGPPVSREQALAFLNQEGRAFERWKQMMQAGEEFIARCLLRQCISPEHIRGCLGPHAQDVTDCRVDALTLFPKDEGL